MGQSCNLGRLGRRCMLFLPLRLGSGHHGSDHRRKPAHLSGYSLYYMPISHVREPAPKEKATVPCRLLGGYHQFHGAFHLHSIRVLCLAWRYWKHQSRPRTIPLATIHGKHAPGPCWDIPPLWQGPSQDERRGGGRELSTKRLILILSASIFFRLGSVLSAMVFLYPDPQWMFGLIGLAGFVLVVSLCWPTRRWIADWEIEVLKEFENTD